MAMSFNGYGEPPEAESWYINVEQIFDVMKCSGRTNCPLPLLYMRIELTIGSIQ